MIKFLNKRKKSEDKEESQEKENKEKDNTPPEEYVSNELSRDYKENLDKFKEYFKDSSDAVFREFTLGVEDVKCALVFIDGLADKTVLHEHIMIPLMQGVGQLESPNQLEFSKDNAYEVIKDRILAVAEIKESDSLDKTMISVMSGETALIIDGSSKIIITNTRGWEKRSVGEPENEIVIRGPREGFVETLRINTALIRRRCRDVNFSIKVKQIGRRSKTDIAICYIKGIINPKILEELERRLDKIDTDKVLGAGTIEQFIEDSTWSIFPQIQYTERPDKAVAAITEGRAVVIIDGTPSVLIVPSMINQFIQSGDDYYERWQIGTLLRMLRWIAGFIALFAPGIYIAVTSFHPGMLPTSLALTIAASRENLPFPAIIEALLMEFTLELLREAGARLPKPIGQTIGIVGGIIIGDAAVSAGIASPIMIIVVAVTAIASFVIPTYSLSIAFRVLRFPIMIVSAIFGLYGVILGFILITVHLASLKSFGFDYAAPFMPANLSDLKDSLVRVPNKYMYKRPEELEPLDKYRGPKKAR